MKHWIASARSGLGAVLLGLAVGAVGGYVAHLLHVPLAFMLGSMFATMAASMLGAAVAPAMRLRAVFLIVVGLFLGQGFDAALLARIPEWPLTIALAILYVPAAGAAAYLIYRALAAMTRVDALFSAIPGGLSGVILMAQELGADERKVALSQSLRVAFVVVAAPALFFGLLGYQQPDAAAAVHHDLTGAEAALLVAAAALVLVVLVRVGAPLPFLMGPMLASAVLRLGGWVEGDLPHWLVESALVVIGATIGCRFAGVELREFGRVALWTLVGTGAMILLSALFALIAAWAIDLDLVAAVLAFAPGGVAEMALIAIAIDADPGFVATHHLARIAFIVLAAPIFATWTIRRWSRRDEPAE